MRRKCFKKKIQIGEAGYKKKKKNSGGGDLISHRELEIFFKRGAGQERGGRKRGGCKAQRNYESDCRTL